MKGLVEFINEALKVNSKSKISDNHLKHLIDDYIEEVNNVLSQHNNEVYKYSFRVMRPGSAWVLNVNGHRDKSVIGITIKLRHEYDPNIKLPLVGTAVGIKGKDYIIYLYEEDGELKF